LSFVAKRLYLPVLAVLVGAALIGLLVYGVSAQAPTRTLDDALARGQHPPAPNAAARLPLLSRAGSGSLASYRGHVVVLSFWASWCEPCQTEAPLLERAQRELLRHRGTVLGVTYQDASPDSQGFVRRFHLTYPNLRDPTEGLAQAFGTKQVPETFLIDRGGRLAAIARGEVDGAFLKRAVSLAESS
jgi:cytochrome c biogenesis protein CcmG, thiol:disulfide interchange protein DsbE